MKNLQVFRHASAFNLGFTGKGLNGVSRYPAGKVLTTRHGLIGPALRVNHRHCEGLICHITKFCLASYLFNILKPNDIYICRTAALTSRPYIFKYLFNKYTY